jgi:hypothetical protein
LICGRFSAPADRGGCGVEDIDLVLVDHLPEAGAVGVVRHALEHQRGAAIGERAINRIGVAGDPADIGSAPKDFAGVIIEHVLMGEAGPDQIAAGGVQHAFRLAGGAGGVEDEQGVFGVHLHGRMVGRGFGGNVFVPDVATVLHFHFPAGYLRDDDGFHRRAGFQRGVDIDLQRHLAAAAPAFIGGDHRDGVAVLDPVGEAIRRESAEHDGMNGTDSRTGEQRHRGLDNHRQVDGDHVTFFDAAIGERIGQPADLFMQRFIGDIFRIVRVIPFPDDRGLIAALSQVPVQAIGGHVQRAVLKPFNGYIALEGGVLDLGGTFDPIDPLGLLGPEGIGFGCGTQGHFLILFRI